MQTTLITTAGPLYATRLVREVRASFEHGVYLNYAVAGREHNVRINSICYQRSSGLIIAGSFREGLFSVRPEHFADAFEDGYGRTIVATRRIN